MVRESGGVSQHIADLGDGDYFGEMAVLADVSRNATVIATTAADLLLIHKDDFNQLKTSVAAFRKAFEKTAEERGAAASARSGSEESAK